MLDGADRDAAARRQEAEAVYETQRAKAAAAAADFETTLAQRRRERREGVHRAAGQRRTSSSRRWRRRSRRSGTKRRKMRADAEVQARRLIEDAEHRPARPSPRAVRTPTGSAPSPTASWRPRLSGATASTRSSATCARCSRPSQAPPRRVCCSPSPVTRTRPRGVVRGRGHLRGVGGADRRGRRGHHRRRRGGRGGRRGGRRAGRAGPAAGLTTRLHDPAPAVLRHSEARVVA